MRVKSGENCTQLDFGSDPETAPKYNITLTITSFSIQNNHLPEVYKCKPR